MKPKLFGTALLLLIFIWFIVSSTGGANEIIESKVSPNGKYIAYKFRRNPGATSGFTWELRVKKNGRPLRDFESGNVFASDYDFYDSLEFEWESDSVLRVVYSEFDDVLLEKTEVNDYYEYHYC